MAAHKTPYVKPPLVAGRTYRLLINDPKKRVAAVVLNRDNTAFWITLKPGWLWKEGDRDPVRRFTHWEAGRNALRKAVQDA